MKHKILFVSFSIPVVSDSALSLRLWKSRGGGTPPAPNKNRSEEGAPLAPPHLNTPLLTHTIIID